MDDVIVLSYLHAYTCLFSFYTQTVIFIRLKYNPHHIYNQIFRRWWKMHRLNDIQPHPVLGAVPGLTPKVAAAADGLFPLRVGCLCTGRAAEIRICMAHEIAKLGWRPY